MKNRPSFDNTEIAFRGKSNRDLNRAYWLFRIISSNFLTKIGPPLTNFALRTGLPVKGIIRKTIFNHFCGGETIEDCGRTIRTLSAQQVGTILDYSVEGEEEEPVFDATEQEIIRAIRVAQNNKDIPFAVFKPSGLGRFELFEKVNSGQPLLPDEQSAFDRTTRRIEHICTTAYEADVCVLIDAEHSWIQDAIDDIARKMMQRYNRNRPLVYNTYQLYRHDKLASLQADYYVAGTAGYFLGAKLVRGAYMEIERERAAETGYPSPIQPDKASADRDYNEAIRFCLDHIDRIGFMAGTHNEVSSALLAEETDKRGLRRDHPHIYFAQLLGMSDHLTFNLAHAGYNVAKYVPYGPVKAVMPYLFRRAQENTSVAGQTGRELGLLLKEKHRRKVNRT